MQLASFSLLWRVAIRFLNITVGTRIHSAARTLAMLGLILDEKVWFTFQFIPKCSLGMRAGIYADH